MPRGRFWRALAGAALVAAGLAACQQAPVTGRQQLVLLSPQDAAALGATAFQEIKQSTPVSRNATYNQAVSNVVSRLIPAAGAGNLPWEFVVFQDSEPNAFALPGGKIGVNSGLFSVAQNEAQLAAVLAHEIAHVTAQHSAERYSQAAMVQTGLQALSSGGSPALAQAMAVAATVGIGLPFSRAQEAEADEIGIMYMARAGYDPREAIALWQNFARMGSGRPPEFLSTHPLEGNRIARLEQLMPQAMAVWQQSRRG